MLALVLPFHAIIPPQFYCTIFRISSSFWTLMWAFCYIWKVNWLVKDARKVCHLLHWIFATHYNIYEAVVKSATLNTEFNLFQQHEKKMVSPWKKCFSLNKLSHNSTSKNLIFLYITTDFKQSQKIPLCIWIYLVHTNVSPLSSKTFICKSLSNWRFWD